MGRKQLNHVHEFVRFRGSRTKYKCASPDCMFTTGREEVKGKRSICSVCHSTEIIMDPYNMRLAGPRCDDCSKSLGKANQARLKRNFSTFLTDIFDLSDSKQREKDKIEEEKEKEND